MNEVTTATWSDDIRDLIVNTTTLRLYNDWKESMDRCYTPGTPRYYITGEAGCEVNSRWKDAGKWITDQWYLDATTRRTVRNNEGSHYTFGETRGASKYATVKRLSVGKRPRWHVFQSHGLSDFELMEWWDHEPIRKQIYACFGGKEDVPEDLQFFLSLSDGGVIYGHYEEKAPDIENEIKGEPRRFHNRVAEEEKLKRGGKKKPYDKT